MTALLAFTGLDDASTFAPRVNALFDALLIASAAMILILGTLNLAFLIRYRKGSSANRRPVQLSTWKIEAAWTIPTTVIFIGLFYWGASLYLDMEDPPANAPRIAVIGRQWMWDVRYPGGRREFNALHLPVNEPVRLFLTSEDVIHSFFIPAFRVKQDVVPGKEVSTWFTPTKTGDYVLFCSQYCGTAHSQMIGHVVVLSPPDYANWLRSENVPAGIAAPP